MTSNTPQQLPGQPQVFYGDDVRTILRTAAHTAAEENRRVTPDDLRVALSAPRLDLPPVQLNKTRATQAVLDRARQLALVRQASYLEHADLQKALAEAGAAAAGLDLGRLQFVRFALERARQEVIGSLGKRVRPFDSDVP